MGTLGSYLGKKFTGGVLFGVGLILVFGVYMLVRAVAPGVVTNPAFGPTDDDVVLGGPAKYVNGNQISGLVSGMKYAIMVYGYMPNLGGGNDDLPQVIIQDCGGSNLQTTQTATINWTDGHPPFSVVMVITAPGSGCVRGVLGTSGGAVLNMASWSV